MTWLKTIRSAIIAAILAAAPVPTIAFASAPFPDQATWGGTSGGSANAQTLTIANYSARLAGVPLRFIAGFTNSAAATLNVSGTGAASIYKPTGGGPQLLAGGEIVAGQLQTVTWDGSRYMLVPPQPQLVSGFLGLQTQVTSVTQVNITAIAVTVTDAAGYGYRLSSVNVTCAITTAGINGLDTGAEAASTWYSTWIAYNPATATSGCLLSTATSAPTLPAGYTAYLRTGWVRNDASSNFWFTLQRGARAQVIIGTNPTTLPVVASARTTFPTAEPVGNFVPPTARSIYLGIIDDGGGGAGSFCYVAPSASYTTGTAFAATNYYNSGPAMLFVSMALESSNIYWGTTNTPDPGGHLYLTGWDDNL